MYSFRRAKKTIERYQKKVMLGEIKEKDNVKIMVSPIETIGKNDDARINKGDKFVRELLKMK